jgi:hypothetical protein
VGLVDKGFLLLLPFEVNIIHFRSGQTMDADMQSSASVGHRELAYDSVFLKPSVFKPFLEARAGSFDTKGRKKVMGKCCPCRIKRCQTYACSERTNVSPLTAVNGILEMATYRSPTSVEAFLVVLCEQLSSSKHCILEKRSCLRMLQFAFP